MKILALHKINNILVFLFQLFIILKGLVTSKNHIFPVCMYLDSNEIYMNNVVA